MLIDRKKGGALARSIREFGDLESFIRKIVNIHCAAEIARSHWLTEREKDFFVASVVNDVLGNKNPISDEAVEVYRKIFKHTVTKVNIADYLGRLQGKNWITYDVEKKKVELPLLFRGIQAEKDNMEFKLQLVYERHDAGPHSDGDGSKEHLG